MIEVMWTMDSRAIKAAIIVNVLVVLFFVMCLRLLTCCLRFSGALKGLFQDHVEYFDIVDEAEEAKIAYLRPHTRRARDYEHEKRLRLRKQQRVAQSKRVWFPRTLLGVVHMVCPIADALTFAAFAFATPTPLSATAKDTYYGQVVYYLHIITRYFLLDFSTVYSEADQNSNARQLGIDNVINNLVHENKTSITNTSIFSSMGSVDPESMRIQFLISFWLSVFLAVFSIFLFVSGIRSKSTDRAPKESKETKKDSSSLSSASQPLLQNQIGTESIDSITSTSDSHKKRSSKRCCRKLCRRSQRSCFHSCSRSCSSGRSKISRWARSFVSGAYRFSLHLAAPLLTAPICSSLMRTFSCAYPHEQSDITNVLGKVIPPFMTSAPGIICWEKSHVRLVTIASIIFVVYYSVAAIYVSSVVGILLRDEQATGAARNKNAIYYSSPLLLLLFQVKVMVSFVVSYWGGFLILPDSPPVALYPAYITSIPLAILLIGLLYYNCTRTPSNVELLNALYSYAITFALAVTICANASLLMGAMGWSLTGYIVCIILIIWVFGASIHYFSNYSGGSCMCFQPRVRRSRSGGNNRDRHRDGINNFGDADGFGDGDCPNGSGGIGEYMGEESGAVGNDELVDVFALGGLAPVVPTTLLSAATASASHQSQQPYPGRNSVALSSEVVTTSTMLNGNASTFVSSDGKSRHGSKKHREKERTRDSISSPSLAIEQTRLSSKRYAQDNFVESSEEDEDVEFKDIEGEPDVTKPVVLNAKLPLDRKKDKTRKQKGAKNGLESDMLRPQRSKTDESTSESVVDPDNLMALPHLHVVTMKTATGESESIFLL